MKISATRKGTYTMLLALIAFSIPLPMLFNNIAIIVLFVFWIIAVISKRTQKPPLNLFLIANIPYILILYGSLYSDNFHQVSVELTKGIPFLVLPLVLFTTPFKIHQKELNTIFKGFILGTLFICIILMVIIGRFLLAENYSTQILWKLTHQNLSSHVNLNAIYLSLYISLSLTIILYYFLKTKTYISNFKKTMYLGGSLLLFVSLIFLSSRTVFITTIIVNSILFLYCQLKVSKTRNVIGLLMIVICFLSIFAFTVNPIFKWRINSIFDTQDEMISPDKEQGVKMRSILWSSSLEVFKENWLLGVGTGDYKDELEKVYRKNQNRIQFRHHMNSHNQYVSYLVSYGFLGTLLFLFYLGSCIFIFATSNNKLSFFLILTFMLCFITESYLYTNKGVIVVALFLTLLLRATNDAKIVENEET